MSLKQGYIQVYTGNGKGKTTAALGLALRAVGRGMKVNMVQFLKSSETGELLAAPRLSPFFKIYRFEKPRKFFWLLNEAEKQEVKAEAAEAFKFIQKCVAEKDCDILILDEIMGALSNNLLEEKNVVDLLKLKPECMEIILTGRNLPDGIAQCADLITEMRDIKHYMDKGVPARDGIEQ